MVNESLIINWISDSLWPLSSLLSLSSSSSSPRSLSPSYCPVIVLSCLPKAFHRCGYVFKLSRFVIQFQWSCSIHWIPTEFYSNFDFARGSVAADVWAFGTTLWEIFAYGECPPETSNVDSIKKVQFVIFISWSCSHVLSFFNYLKSCTEHTCVMISILFLWDFRVTWW